MREEHLLTWRPYPQSPVPYQADILSLLAGFVLIDGSIGLEARQDGRTGLVLILVIVFNVSTAIERVALGLLRKYPVYLLP
jgi:hypothetical protein